MSTSTPVTPADGPARPEGAGDRADDVIAVGRLNTAYAQSKVLHSAVEVGLFELLADKPADLAVIAERLGLRSPMLADFLRALVALGLLERDGELYRTSPRAEACLVPGTPYDLGASVRTTSARHYALWGGLTAALRGEEPSGHGRAGAFDRLYRDHDAARRFLQHMDSAHALVGPQLAGALDWKRWTSFVDVGGARGHIAAALLRAYPHLTGGVFELPAVEPLFDEHIREAGLTDRCVFHAGDFFADPLPSADVLVLGHVLHDWEPADRRRLVEGAFRALAPGGALVVYDQMLDDRDPDLAAVLGSLNVALMTGGSEYPMQECEELLTGAGFRVEEYGRLHTIGSDYVFVAVRP